MKIELKELTIREVVENYADCAEDGVTGYNGRLNIRPKYQREFIYEGKDKTAVIDTIRRGFPLNAMYWIVNSDDDYEILDGQQRTLSFCTYVNGDFSVKFDDGHEKKFQNLTETEKQRILDYKLMVYICEGNDQERLDWFKIINIAGKKLTDQEARNAVYTGTWLTHAKSIFSKSNCAAYNLSKDYVGGSPIRQELLETALKWASKGDIEKYMGDSQHKPNANELWTYFQSVINWVTLTFTKYRKEMKGLDWGWLYDEFHTKTFDTKELEAEIKKLMQDDDVTSQKGIYYYVLTRKEKYLSIRAFTDNQKNKAYERQKGVCPHCKEHFMPNKMEADHITPWSEGGKTELDNCQMLCKDCNRRKSNK